MRSCTCSLALSSCELTIDSSAKSGEENGLSVVSTGPGRLCHEERPFSDSRMLSLRVSAPNDPKQFQSLGAALVVVDRPVVAVQTRPLHPRVAVDVS